MSCGGVLCEVLSCFDCYSATLTPILFALVKFLGHKLVQSALKEIWNAFNEWLEKKYGGWNEILKIAFDKGEQAAISALEAAKDDIVRVCQENHKLLELVAKVSTKFYVGSVATKQAMKTAADMSVQEGTKQATTQAAIKLVAAEATKSGSVATKQAMKTAADSSVQEGIKQATTQAAIKLVAEGATKSGTKQAAVKLATAQATKGVIKATTIKPSTKTVIQATKLVAAKPVAMSAATVAKSMATPLSIGADLTQAGLEVAGYTSVGKAVGFTGNVVAGAMVGSITGPAGAVAGAAIGTGVWVAGEVAGRFMDRAFGNRFISSKQEDLERNTAQNSTPSVSENKPPSPLIQTSSGESLECTNQNPRQPEGGILQSTYYDEAKKIPFMHHTTLECGPSGLEHTIEDHDITLHIPEGAVAENQTIDIEIGVTMYGRFVFPKNTQPISPIVWLHLLNGDTKLKKPFRLVLPHFLTGLTKDELCNHHVCFAQANHLIYTIEDDEMKYEFKPYNSEPRFASSGNKSYAVLESDHCCFYCLLANQMPEFVRDASFCLTRVEHSVSPQREEVYFVATYFLNTCIQALKEQFKTEDGYTISRHDHFKFKDESIKFIRILPSSCQHAIALEPSTANITASDIDFSSMPFHEMQLKHDQKMYPPCVKMTVTMANTSPFKLCMKVTGCSGEHQLDVDIAFPLKFTPSIQHLQRCESHTIVTKGDTPKLKDVFGKLLPLAEHWHNIGILLGINDCILGKIQCDNRQVCDCLREMLKEWLRTDNPPSTWKDLPGVIEHFHPAKAEELRKFIAE